MTIEDQRELIKCYDALLQAKAEYKDKQNTKEQEINDYEAERTLILKDETETTVDAKGNEKVKNKYTEIQIKSIIQQELLDKKRELAEIKFISDKVDGKQKAVFSYITCVRDLLRPNLVLTQE